MRVRLVFRRSRVESSCPAEQSLESTGHEIISTAFLSLPLIQAGQLSVSGERMRFKYWLVVNRLGLNLPRKYVTWLTANVIFLSFRIDRSGQTLQTQIRPLLEVCNSICIDWTHYSIVEPHSSNFRVITTNFRGVRLFRKFTVNSLLVAILGKTPR